MTDLIAQPLGPYKQYDKIPEPDPSRDLLVDPRTGVLYGQFTEEEITTSIADTIATATTVGKNEKEILPTELALQKSIETTPPQEKFRTDILGIVSNNFQQSQLTTKINSLYSKARETKDLGYIEEAKALEKERETLALDIPDDADLNIIQEIAGLTSAVGWQMVDAMRTSLDEAAAGATAGGVTGATLAAITGPGATVGAGAGAAAGATYGMTAGMFKYSLNQMVGETFGRMVGDETIDPEIASQVAEEFGLYQAIPETLSFGVLSKIMKGGLIGNLGLTRMSLGASGEGGTEGIQEALGIAAVNKARRLTAEKRGEEFTETPLEAISAGMSQIKENIRGGILGGGGIGVASKAAGAAVRAPKYSTEAFRALGKRSAEKRAAAKAELDARLVKEEKQQLRENAVKPAVAAVDNVTKQKLEPAPITPPEVQKAVEAEVVPGTVVRNGDIDDVMLDNSDENIYALVSKVGASITQEEEDFSIELRRILPDEPQAQAIEDILSAHAGTFGMSKGEYITKRKLAIQKGEGGPGTVAAEVALYEDGKAVITAFERADVSSVVHEIGHVFRQEIQGDALNTLDDWVGIARGAAWDVAAEEKFARGWERYLAEGKAPVPELTRVFEQFKQWMVNIYRAIKGSEIDVPITPEVRKVFDGLLTEGSAKNNAAALFGREGRTVTLEQTKAPNRQQVLDDAMRQAEENALIAEAVQGRDDMTADEALKAQIKIKTQMMREMFDAGETLGAQMKRAEIKALLGRERKMQEIQRRHDTLRVRVVDKLKSVQPKGVNNRLRSQLSYDVQEVLTELYGLIAPFRSLKAAQQEYNSMQDDDWVNATGLTALRNQFIKAAVDRDQQGMVQMQQVYNEVMSLITEGKANSPFMLNELEARALVNNSIPDIVGQGVDLKAEIALSTPEQAHLRRQKEKTVRDKIATSTLGKNFIFGWGGLINIITAYSPVDIGQAEMRRRLDFFSARQQQWTDTRLAAEEMVGEYMKAYGIKNEYVMNSKMNKDSELIFNIGTKNLKSKDQLIQYWMYMQDPNLTQRLEAMGIDTAVRDAIESHMTEQDRQFARSMLNMLQRDEEYTRNNEVHKRIVGVDLERIPNYVPIRSQAWDSQQRREASEQVINQLQHDHILRLTPESAKHIKQRSKDARNAPLIIEGARGMFTSYQEEMAHFRAFAEPVRLAYAVLKNRKFKQAVEFEYGAAMYNALKKSLDSIASDGKNEGGRYPVIDRFRSAFVSSTIGASLAVMVKQYISIVNAFQHVNGGEFVSGFLAFMANPIKNYREVSGLEHLKNRTGHMERDLKNFTNSAEYKRFRINPTIMNFATMNVRIGDAGGVAVSTWIIQRALKKRVNPDTGKLYTQAEAYKEASRLSEQTQQSGAIEEQALFQKNGSFARLATMYSTGPVQAVRQEMEAVRAVVNGRMTYSQFVKTIFIYHFLVPSMYSLAASLIVGDEPEDTVSNMTAASVLGPMGSMYAGGRVLNVAVRKLMGLSTYQDSGPFSNVVDDAIEIGDKFLSGDQDELTADDYGKAFQAALNLGGIGLPVNRVQRMGENLLEENYKGAILGTNPNKE